MRRLSFFLGIAFLLTLSAYLWSDRTSPEAPKARAPVPQGRPLLPEPEDVLGEGDLKGSLASGDVQGEDSARIEAQGPLSADVGPVEAESEAGGPAAWEGRVELVRADGSVDTALDGTFRFMLWRGNSGRSELVEVSEGRFEFPVEQGDSDEELPAIAIEPEFGTFGLLHGGPWQDPAIPEAERERRVPWQRGELAVVRLGELAPVQLHVHDVGTGQSLGNVDLVIAPDFYGWGDPEPLPGVAPTLWRDGVAVPLELSFEDLPKQALRTLKLPLQIGAEGYAWRGVKLSLNQAEAHVGLALGGSLEIQVSGLSDVKDLKLTLNGDGHLGTWPLREDGLLRFEGVSAGRVRAQVHRSDWFSIDKTFADGAADIVAGETTSMDLAIDPSAGNPVRVFDVELLMAVPEEWEAESYSAFMSLVESPAGGGDVEGARFEPAEAEPGWTIFRSQEMELQEGVWALDGRDVPWRCTFGVDGDGEIRLEVPAPVVTQLRVVDKQTGAVPEDLRVNWNGLIDGRGSGYSLHEAESAEGAGEYQIRTPRSRLNLSVRCPSHFPKSLELQPDELGGVLTLELERAQGLVLRMRDEQGEVPKVEGFWDLGFQPTGGGEMPPNYSRSGNRRELRIAVGEAGSYDLSFPEFAGYEWQEVRTIDIAEGEFTELEIVLKTHKP